MKKFIKKNLWEIFSCCFFLVGIIWRYVYLFYIHPATEFVYSDMQMYFDLAIHYFDPSYTANITDTVYPPGIAYYFGFFYFLDPSWHLAIFVQFFLSSLVPALAAVLGYELYGKRVAWIVLAATSLYFPFIDYASYFLSENPFLFFMLLSLWLLSKSLRTQRYLSTLLFSLGAGLTLGAAASLKSVVLLSAFLVFGALSCLVLKHGLRQMHLTVIGGAVGLMVLIVPMAARCTHLNEGNYCTINTNGGVAVLLGHFWGAALSHPL